MLVERFQIMWPDGGATDLQVRSGLPEKRGVPTWLVNVSSAVDPLVLFVGAFERAGPL